MSFRNLSNYVAIPRVTALRLSPDGSWLAAAVQTIGGEPNKYLTSIWRIAALTPQDRPVRLTRSAEGEGDPEFLPDGSLLFVSKRPAPPDGPGGDDGDVGQDKPALWLLPAGGGEARRIAAPPGGVGGVTAARGTTPRGTAAVVFAALTMDGAEGADEDLERRKARKDAGVTAILHESGPVRYWDHDLGPDSLRLRVGEFDGAETLETRDLTPDPGRALDENSFQATADGAAVVTSWSAWDEAGNRTTEVDVIDTATGERRVLLASPDCDFEGPRISPDGRLVACGRAAHDSYDAPGDVTLVVVPLDGDAPPRDLLDGFDRRPQEIAWAPDSAAVYFTADDQGRRPVFRAGLATGEITRLTADGAYDNLCPSPDGRFLYALRSAVDEPPTPVRIDVTSLDAAGGGGEPVRLASPGSPLELPGRLEEIETTAADGARIRAWLVLPDTVLPDTVLADTGVEASPGAPAAPAPLLLWVHGGPVMSWNAWSWRWNPWLMAARGYAVLLPDPALSTGYGQEFIARGHGQWGERPYHDLMAITDAAVARPDIDEARTAMMGGSFGGYMANWMAGHTDRFTAIVSHAGLWLLDQMFGTTDLPSYWRRIFGDPLTQPERYLANSPNRSVDKITTPMLVIHGDKDYRVPVGEAVRLWWDVQGRVPGARFLYFPDENHWILKPGHVTVWYETVIAFLAQHVLGEPWQRPELL
jgi:dipeptidyl aminopeptidase/acylaminoacyl peptidase